MLQCSMQFIRAAAEGEVLAACTLTPSAQRAALLTGPFSVWNFTLEDLESVVARLPDTTYDAPLEDLRPAWKAFLQKDAAALTRYQSAVALLATSGTLPSRPILHRSLGQRWYPRYVLDGQERLFAALDFAVGRSDFTAEVFWSDE